MNNLNTMNSIKHIKKILLSAIVVNIMFQVSIFANDAYELKIDAPIKTWDEAVPLGNGLTGCLVWGENNLLRFSFDRGDLWDNRVPSEIEESGFTFANIQKAG